MIASKSQGSGNREPGEPHRVSSPVHIIRLTEASYIDSRRSVPATDDPTGFTARNSATRDCLAAATATVAEASGADARHLPIPIRKLLAGRYHFLASPCW